jgi:hypothetical protein
MQQQQHTHSNQTHANLTQTFTAEVAQINKLIAAYTSAAGAARNFAMNNPGMMLPGRGARKFASGIVSVFQGQKAQEM